MGSSVFRTLGRGAAAAGRHLFPDALVTGAKKGAFSAGGEYGTDFLKDQIKMYDRDVIEPGRQMMPDFMKFDNKAAQIGSDLAAEQLGLLKYIQDKTIKPWLDLGAGIIPKAELGEFLPPLKDKRDWEDDTDDTRA
jgi:hypothetical protein